MTDSLDLNEIAKRPSRYWNRDGLVEVFVGLMMLVPAMLFALAGQLPKGSPLVMIAPLAWIAVILALKRCLTWFKDRLVVPRAGYVQLADPAKAARIGTIAVGVLLAIAFTLLLPGAEAWGTAPGLALGLLLSACFVVAWVQARDARLLALAGVPLLVELCTYGRGFSSRQTLSLLLIAQGAGLVLSGLLRLRSFLKENPAGSLDA
jgi:hypothetical protein